MKRLLVGLLLFVPAALFAQSAFDGTWVFTAESGQFGGKPMILSLKDGIYRCDSCVPKIETEADGKDHKRTGSPYNDVINIRVVDDRTVESIGKKRGKVVGKSIDTVSQDGNTLTSNFTFTADNGEKGSGTTIYKRVAPAPPGAHKISGTWQTEKLENASASMMTVTYKSSGDGLSMSDPTGDSYTAKFDGKEYPYKGDPGTTSVSLKKIDDHTIEETDFRNGKVISVSRMTVSPDGRTMKVESEDKLHGTTAKFEGKKQ